MTEHKYGSEVVQLICNVALMTGNVGRLGAALLPLRGQNNVQGSSRHGRAAGHLHRLPPASATRTTARSFEEAWGVKVPREKGYSIPQMFDAAVAGDLKAMYIFGEDVAQTDPNTAHVVAALENLEFLVCQDIFETETTKYADVILPALGFLEKEGTFTNAERRVQLVGARDRAARRRQDRLRDHRRSSPSALGHELRLGRARGRDGRGRAAHAALGRRSPTSGSAARACSGRSRPTAPTRRSSTSASSSSPAARRTSPRCPTRRPATPPTRSSR